MVITVMPRPALSALTISKVSCWKRISRLLVGSSSSMTLGRWATARAINTRWRSPPESWLS